MPALHRLTRQLFPRTVRRRVSGTYLSIAMAPMNGLTEPKFTCVVSKKVSPKAVERNRLKRRCREAFRPLLRDLPPVAFIIYPKRVALDVPFAELSREMATLVGKSTA